MIKYKLFSTELPLESDGDVTFLQITAGLVTCHITGIELSFGSVFVDQVPVKVEFLEQDDSGAESVSATLVPLISGGAAADATALTGAIGVSNLSVIRTLYVPIGVAYCYEFPEDDFIEIPAGTMVGVRGTVGAGSIPTTCLMGLTVGEI